MIDWIIINKEWIFSGIGVLMISSIIGLLIKNKHGIVQKQKSGKNSVNFQSTSTITIGNFIKGEEDVRKTEETN